MNRFPKSVALTVPCLRVGAYGHLPGEHRVTSRETPVRKRGDVPRWVRAMQKEVTLVRETLSPPVVMKIFPCLS
jgi:hypothetical protein